MRPSLHTNVKVAFVILELIQILAPPRGLKINNQGVLKVLEGVSGLASRRDLMKFSKSNGI